MTKKDDFLVALMQHPTVTAAAKAANVRRATAHTWLNDPEFQRDLSRLRTETLGAVASYLQGRLALCAEALMAIVEDEHVSPQIRINAIQQTFAACRSLTENVEMLHRIEELEARAAEFESATGKGVS